MTGDCCFLPLHRLQMLPDLVALPSGRACREMLPTWYLAQVLVSRSGQRPAMTMERCHTVEEGLCAGVRCSHPVFSNSWFLPVLSSYIPRVRRHHSRGGFPGTPLVLVQGPKSPGLHWSLCRDQGPRDSTGHSARTKVPGIPLVILQGPRSPGLHWSFCKDQGPRDSTSPSARTNVVQDSIGHCARTKVPQDSTGHCERTKVPRGSSGHSARTKVPQDSIGHCARTKVPQDSTGPSARTKVSQDSTGHSARTNVVQDSTGHCAKTKVPGTPLVLLQGPAVHHTFSHRVLRAPGVPWPGPALLVYR
nr:uncharacterized protein LOC127488262 isoform X3 [Oryctolagus cuniculus]